jgi:3'-5' exoribonuclease
MERLTKKQPINTLKDGISVDDIFVVKIKKSIVPYVKGHSFTLILSDSSGGSIEYKYWGGQDEGKVRNLFDSIKKDSVVLVRGKVSTYHGKLQISADEQNVLKVLSPEEYEAEFVMGPRKNVEEMYSVFLSKIGSVQNESLKALLLDTFGNDLKEKFKKHPGAIQIHHNWIGGLLQHTLEVVEYCETAIKLNPELDRDLLLAGALLHDVGKLDELEVTSRIKGSRKGQLLGHLALGMIFLSEKLKESKLDDLLKDKLLHLLASHHGKLDFGSPKEPMTPEALALYYADELSSKLSETIEFIKENKEKTEDESMYHSKKGINIFLR